jgi:hypothetical protein
MFLLAANFLTGAAARRPRGGAILRRRAECVVCRFHDVEEGDRGGNGEAECRGVVVCLVLLYTLLNAGWRTIQRWSPNGGHSFLSSRIRQSSLRCHRGQAVKLSRHTTESQVNAMTRPSLYFIILDIFVRVQLRVHLIKKTRCVGSVARRVSPPPAEGGEDGPGRAGGGARGGGPSLLPRVRR